MLPGAHLEVQNARVGVVGGDVLQHEEVLLVGVVRLGDALYHVFGVACVVDPHSENQRLKSFLLWGYDAI